MTERALRWPYLWGGLGVLMCLQVFAAALSRIDFLGPVTLWDKAQHAIAFFVLTVWFSALVSRRRVGWLVLAMLAFGGLIELAQMSVTYRHAELADFIADAVGVIAGAAVGLAGARHWARWLEQLGSRWLPDR